MFLNLKQQKAVEFLITVLESRGLEVHYPHLMPDSKTEIRDIRWVATNKGDDIKARILLIKWNKKFKLILWLPKNPAEEFMSNIDPYVVLSESRTYLILPHGMGQLSLHKTSPDMFMTLQEMRGYLGY